LLPFIITDFAVGAPYEVNPVKEDLSVASTGAVYIFRGDENPYKIALSQKIFATDVNLPSLDATADGLKSFGYSLSGGMDMDQNNFPDLAIGALNSNSIVLLRTRPIIHLNVFIRNNHTIQDIDQKVKECKSDPSVLLNDLVCFSFDMCFEFANVNQFSNVNTLPMLEYALEAEPNVTDINTRVYFSKTSSRVVRNVLRLDLNDVTCDRVNVYIKKENSDFLRPIRFLVNYTFEAEGPEEFIQPALGEIRNRPVIHADADSFRFEANFKKDCGADKKCTTDLRLNAYFADLIIGEDRLPLLSFKESDTITITVLLENNDLASEPAYATQIDVEFDDRLDFIKKHDHVGYLFYSSIE
jgi:hypothetical protein